MAAMQFLRRCSVVIGLILAGLTTCAYGQFKLTPTEPMENAPSPMSYVPPSREILQALIQAREALKQGRTADAFGLLQRLIDLPEDFFTDRTMQQTLKSEAFRILAGLTASERDAYELLQGSAARQLLLDAKAAGDSDRLAEVLRRYPYSQAGLEAAERLALEALDHGRTWQAATQFAALRQLPAISADRARQIGLREAFAWHHGGQPTRAAELLVELTSQTPSFRAQVAGQAVPRLTDMDQAGRWLAQVAGPAGRAVELESAQWLSARGGAAGTAAARETGPIGGPLWQVAHLADLESDLPPKNLGPSGGILSRLLEIAEDPMKDLEQPTWPTTTPLVVGDQIVFRTARDVVALDRRTGEVRWRSVLTDPDFDQLWSDLRNLNPEAGLAQYLRRRIYEDWTYGSVSSDGRRIFAVEGLDFQVPSPNTNVNNGRVFMQNGEEEWNGFNRLAAYELAGGRLAWEIGGNRVEAAGDFVGHFFLGPPLSCDGHLFVLAEVQGEVRLVVLEAQLAGVRKVWSQPVIVPRLPIHRFEDRRRTGLMPASSNGIVICPTGTGAVIGVDFALRRLLWSFQYTSTSPAPVQGMHPLMAANIARANRQAGLDDSDRGWLDGNPVIAEGRVFIAPTDSQELHCLNLVDGTVQWTVPRDRSLYLAGADGDRVVIVGPDRIEALNAADGTPAWSQPVHIPAPTGRGVWMEKRYLIPLSTGEIASIDLTSGKLLARSKLPDGQLPGNLAAGSGALVSLSARQVHGFRSLQETQEFVALRLADDPQDATALARRGELRLHHGEFQAGLADLRAAIARQPEPYAKSVLAAALLEGLRADFVRYRDSVPELEALTDDPEQRHEFLWLVARGLQKTGEPLAAFERMTHLVDDALDDYARESFGAPWQARNDRRLWGLFDALYHDASADDRHVLDRKIVARLPAADAPSDADVVGRLRRYLRAFGFHASAAEARQRLAANLDPEVDAVEWEIEQTRQAANTDPNVAGPAAGALARWFLSRRRFDDASAWLTVLETRFADLPVDGELTGKQLAEPLRTDPALVESGKKPAPWPAGVIEYKRNNQPNTDGLMIRALVVGSVPDHYQGWSFETDRTGLVLVARDDQARQRWRLTRGNSGQGDQFYQPGQHQVHLHGHLVGWSNGTHFQIAADIEPDKNAPRVLWDESLLAPGSSGGANMAFFANQRAPLVIRQGRRNQISVISQGSGGPGALIAITDCAVIYHNGRKLIAADPLTGKLLWSRKDLPPLPSQILADDRLVAVTGQNHQPAEDRGTIRFLRAVDGEQTAAVDMPSGVIEWVGSHRVMRWVDGAPLPTRSTSVELFDVARGESVWKAELARPAAIRVGNDAEVFTIEENRRLTVRNLSDGAIRWTRDLTLAVAAESLFVQRWKDRYLVTVGVTSPQPDVPRVVGFDGQHVPIDGHVLAVDRRTGELLWTNRVEPTAYNTSQPVGWPVLVFAGQMYVTPRANAAPIAPRLTTTLFDKETGKLVYFVEEPSHIGTYFVDVEPERDRVTANYLNWSLVLRYTGKTAE